MKRSFGPQNAEVLVNTFKEGVLSALAHDLTLRVERFGIEWEGERITAWFDAGSLKVIEPKTLPAFAFGEIEKNIASDVLVPAKHPQVKFESTGVSDTEVRGTLTICGTAREVRCTRSGDAVEAKLDQRDFGITPYKAMMGTLKIKPHVVVRVRLS